jgi:hypothetical protein
LKFEPVAKQLLKMGKFRHMTRKKKENVEFQTNGKKNTENGKIWTDGKKYEKWENLDGQ